MNSRERVLAALNHQQPDRPPLDFSGHRSSGIAAIAYHRLRDTWACPPGRCASTTCIQQLAIVDDDVLDLFGVDTIELGRGFALRRRRLGRLGPAGRHPVPDAGLERARARQPGPLGPALRQRARDGADAGWRALLRADVLALAGQAPDVAPDIAGAFEREHVDGDRQPRPARWPAADGGRSLAEGATALARGHRPRHHRPVRRQPARDRPVPLPQRQLLRPAGRRAGARPAPSWTRRSSTTWPTWRSTSPPSGRTSTSSPSATTWACRPARRSRRACTASSSSRATHACGSAPRSWRPRSR